MTTREDVQKLLDALTAIGAFAKADWKCCQSCAWSAVPTLPEGTGVVFYHAQDAEAFDEDGKLTDPLMLRFGVIDYKAGKRKHRAAVKVFAATIVAKARELGLPVAWDGQIDRCIEILPA